CYRDVRCAGFARALHSRRASKNRRLPKELALLVGNNGNSHGFLGNGRPSSTNMALAGVELLLRRMECRLLTNHALADLLLRIWPSVIEITVLRCVHAEQKSNIRFCD